MENDIDKNGEDRAVSSSSLCMVMLFCPLCYPMCLTGRLLNSILARSHHWQTWCCCNHVRDSHGKIEELKIQKKRIKNILEGIESVNSCPRSKIAHIRKVAFQTEDLIELYYLAKEYQKKLGVLQNLATTLVLTCQVNPSIDVMMSTAISIKDYKIPKQTFKEIVASDATTDHISVRECSPCGREKFTVGLKTDIQKLVDKLTRGDDPKLHSVSILGMGGIGKTTLAGKLYTHPTIRKHFSCRLWITVSQQFSYKNILKEILLKRTHGKKILLQEELQDSELKDRVHRFLKKERYLAILDDVWTQEAWETLNTAFPDSNKGSRLIITTRNNELSKGTSDHFYQMRTLTQKESQELFCQKTSISPDDTEFKDIAKKLLDSCAGLPLAITVIGRELMRRKRKMESIYHQLTCLKGNLVKDITKVLSLSYDDLPPHLRSCFLRVAFFPEGREISAKKLIYVWAAEGLLSDNQGMESHGKNSLDDQRMGNFGRTQLDGQEAEKLGKTLLDTLIKRNLIQAGVKSPDGTTIKRCKIHPLMHVFAASMAKEEILFQSKDFSEIRHRAIYSSSPSSMHLDKAPHLHSLFSFQPEGNIPFKLNSICLYSKLLKVLYLEDTKLRKLPDEIGYLWNLRYLNLCNTGIKRLPQSMKFLLRLLTLDVRKNQGLLGIGIVKSLDNLQNLHLNGSKETFRLGSGSQLRSLGSINLQQININDINKMKKLQVLKVIITDSSQCEKYLEVLARLEHLVSLKLVIEDYFSKHPISVQILESSASLRKLHLKVRMPESEMQSNIPARGFYVPFQKLFELETTKMKNLTPSIEFPSGGGFPQLAYLEFIM